MSSRGDRGDIACTVVLLKAMYRAGKIPKPLAVDLCPPGHEDAGWEKAAHEYLASSERKVRPKRPSIDWEEENERMDWEEKHESAN